jgi:hypothetical protein
MKLILENWNSYLSEQRAEQIIRMYITENNIQLTEEQIQEGIPGWVKKMVAAGMLITTAAGVVAPNPAQADTWEDMFNAAAAEQQVEKHDIKMSQDLGKNVADTVMKKLGDSVPDGLKISLDADIVPSANVDQDAFGNSLLNTLKDLLGQKNIEVADMGVGNGFDSRVERDADLTISIMDNADGEATIMLMGDGVLKNLDMTYKVKSQ